MIQNHQITLASGSEAQTHQVNIKLAKYNIKINDLSTFSDSNDNTIKKSKNIPIFSKAFFSIDSQR